MAVSADTIQKVKALAVSEVLAAEGLLLKRVGREFVTHCLWHKDGNPSLTISDDKGFVFCHVCQHHDDAIGFIQQKFGLNFRESCERIASKNNIYFEVSDENPQALQARNELLQIKYTKAQGLQDLYRDNLKKYPESVKFIKSRNIAPETSKFFGLGYCPTNRRITIPIHNHQGKLVGFSARVINNDIKPKYKNTESNEIFNKSDLVFNEYNAMSDIRDADECVFVEGHLDVLSMWQAGVKNVVALQGTASPAKDVLKRLLRKTNRFVLCMDSDTGGNKATAKFLETVLDYTLSGQLDVKIASLPGGLDPDDFIQSGGNISSIIANAPSWMDWMLDEWLKTLDFNDKLKIQNVEKQIKGLFSRIESPALRAHYFDKASIRLAQNKQSLAAEIAKSFHEYKPTKSAVKGWTKPDYFFTRNLVEKRILRLYVHREEYRQVLEPLMGRICNPIYAWLWSRILELQSVLDLPLSETHIMAVLSVAEPQYMQALRAIANPTFLLDDNVMSIAHAEDIMMELPESVERNSNIS